MNNRFATALVVLFMMLLFASSAPLAADAENAAPDIGSQSTVSELAGRWEAVKRSFASRENDAAITGLKDIEGRCMDLGITSFEELSASMVRHGRLLLEDNDMYGAMALFDTAAKISPNYSLPHFAKGWAFLSHDRFKLLMALDSFIEGYTRYANDFWFSFTYAGNRFTSVLFSLAALFCLYGVLTALRFTPLLAHDISELVGRRDAEELIKFVMLPTAYLVLLYVLGFWWAVSAVFLSMWVYFKNSEKFLAAVFFVILVFMPEVMTAYAKFVHAGEKGILWVMDDVNKGRADESTEAFLYEILNKEPENELALMSLAQLTKKQGRYLEAVELYEGLIKLNPDSAIYRNNLGNIYFIQDDLERAEENYKAAINNERERVMPYFNLSQAFGEDLKFTDREVMDRRARELDARLVSFLKKKAGLTPMRMVFDEPVPSRKFWQLALMDSPEADVLAGSIWSSSVGMLPLSATRFAGIGFLVLVFMVSSLRKRGSYAHFCDKCDKVSCRKCQKPHYSKELCPQCYQIFVKLEGVEAKDRVSKTIEVREKQRKKGMACRVASLLLPGSGHLLMGRTLSGALIMGIFVFLFKDLFFGNFFEAPKQFDVSVLVPGSIILGILLAGIYVIAQLDINRVTK